MEAYTIAKNFLVIRSESRKISKLTQLVTFFDSSANRTWLILPVVICLSQRLSHACLSISVSLRNCEWLIKTVIVSMSIDYYLDIHGNSRANTCVQTRLLGRVVLIRLWTIPGLPGFEVIDGNRSNRMLRRRWFIQVSDLSAFDGRVLAYRGIDG